MIMSLLSSCGTLTYLRGASYVSRETGGPGKVAPPRVPRGVRLFLRNARRYREGRMQKYEMSAMIRSPITAEPIDIPAIAPEESGVSP